MRPAETSGSPSPGLRSLGEAGRIIFVNRVYWPAGAATAQLLTDLAEGLAAAGSKVHVIAAGTDPGPRNGVAIHRTGAGETHGGMISRGFNYWRFNRRARAVLAGLVRPGDVVVAMTDPPMLGAAVAPTVVAAGASLVHWIQDIYPEIAIAHVGALAALPLHRLRQARDQAWAAAGTCVTLGADMAATVTARGIPHQRCVVIPNWAPRELQQPAALAAAARREAWGLAGKFVVAYSGNLGRVHEFDTVLAAAARLRARENIAFALIGSGARVAEVQAAARRRELRNMIFLPPEPRENLAASLAAADVQLVTMQPDFAGLVFPSKLAGVLAAGRPVVFVGPPDGDIARRLRDEGGGVALAPGDGRELAGVIAGLEQDADRRRALGRDARQVYEKHYTFAAALQAWRAVVCPTGNPGP